MPSWAATVGGFVGALLAIAAGPWNALVAGLGGEPGAVEAAILLVVGVGAGTAAGAVSGLALARRFGRRGGGRAAGGRGSGGLIVLLAAALASLALPRCGGGDPGRVLAWAPLLALLLPALALLPWALRR